MVKKRKKENIKLNELDQNNRSVSLLRYIAIFTVQNFKEFFITEQIKSVVHEGIYDYFYPNNNNKKKKEVKLISVYVHTNHVEINFQALPVLNLRDSIEKLYAHSKKYILAKLPQLKGNLWSENIFLATRRQLVEQQIEDYLNAQDPLRTVAKL
ncbi:MAG: transposase [Promethearchaeota archaeon]